MSEEEKKAEETGSQFAVQKIYLKDISFESPAPTEYFVKKNFTPEINLQLNTETSKLENDIFEVVLNITVTSKDKEADKVAYLVEIKQAGIFTIANFAEEDMQVMINSYCVNMLFPYAREAVSSIVERGGFPQLLLAPINFDALYRQHLDKVNASVEAGSTAKH